MTIDHRRPLVAYLLCAAVCGVLIVASLGGSGAPRQFRASVAGLMGQIGTPGEWLSQLVPATRIHQATVAGDALVPSIAVIQQAAAAAPESTSGIQAAPAVSIDTGGAAPAGTHAGPTAGHQQTAHHEHGAGQPADHGGGPATPGPGSPGPSSPGPGTSGPGTPPDTPIGSSGVSAPPGNGQGHAYGHSSGQSRGQGPAQRAAASSQPSTATVTGHATTRDRATGHGNGAGHGKAKGHDTLHGKAKGQGKAKDQGKTKSHKPNGHGKAASHGKAKGHK